jgi:hypothetical protein
VYGFANKTSSWHNNQTGGAVSYVSEIASNGNHLLWTEPSPASDDWVGSSLNDRADQIAVC